MEIVNKVAQSPLITINLEELLDFENIKVFDLKPFLFQGLILREKDYRLALKDLDWSEYHNRQVALYCSADAIVPTWAFMLAANYLTNNNAQVYFGDEKTVIEKIFQEKINAFPVEEYENKMIVIKGCFDKPVPISAYTDITKKLSNVAKSVMYGEPCSTVPIFKRK